MKKYTIIVAKVIIGILAVDIILDSTKEKFMGPGNLGAYQEAVAILNIVDEVSSTVHNFVNNLVEGLSAAEFINYLVITIVVIFFLICLFDKCDRKTKALLIDEPK